MRLSLGLGSTYQLPLTDPRHFSRASLTPVGCKENPFSHSSLRKEVQGSRFSQNKWVLSGVPLSLPYLGGGERGGGTTGCFYGVTFSFLYFRLYAKVFIPRPLQYSARFPTAPRCCLLVSLTHLAHHYSMRLGAYALVRLTSS